MNDTQIGQAALDLLYRLIAALETAPEVAVFAFDKEGTLRFWNRASATLFGVPAEQALGQHLSSLFKHPGREEEYEAAVASIWNSGQPAPAADWLVELPSGEQRWVSCSMFPVHHNGERPHIFCMDVDLTARKREEERNRHHARHDFLTGLPNAMLFEDRLHQALAIAQRKHSQVAVLFIDLDRFKAINDLYGHACGDKVLIEVAQRLSHCVRGADTVSRKGGDEFVVILSDVGGPGQAAHIAASMLHAVHQIRLDGLGETSVSCSIGIGMYPGDGIDAETLLKHADVAMYHAKQAGRNGFQFFTAEMTADVVARIGLENSLRQALEREEFFLEYQPELNCATGETRAVEALLRWRHPEHGVLTPAQFLPLAESIGLVQAIGHWVMEQACLQAQAWRSQGLPLQVAVNLAKGQLLNGRLVESVEAALAHSKLPPHCLELEVTEAMIMGSNPHTSAAFASLRARGVHITVDDFGSGTSSLARLREFPLSKLKIDRSFVDDAVMIPLIVALARSLGLTVVAEGVETKAQLDFLRASGCDDYQGFYNRQLPDPKLADAAGP